MKKLSYTNILQANNSSQSLHNLIVINTKKEDYGLWIAAKNRSVELEKNLLNNNRKIEIITLKYRHPNSLYKHLLMPKLDKYSEIALIIRVRNLCDI